MSKVTQCDRCKAIIIYPKKRNDSPEEEWWRYSIERDAWPYRQIDNIDLCDDCLHSLYNWLMGGDKRN